MTLKEWMASRRWKSVQIAEKLGVSRGFISLISNGKRMPSPALAAKIRHLTNRQVNISDFAATYKPESRGAPDNSQVVNNPS